MVGIIDITNVDSVHLVGRTECVGGSKRERLPPLERMTTLPTASIFNGVIIIIHVVFSITDVTAFNLAYYTGTDRERERCGRKASPHIAFHGLNFPGE